MRFTCLISLSVLLGVAGLLTRSELADPIRPTTVDHEVRTLEGQEASAATGALQRTRWVSRCRAIVGVCFRESGAPCVCIRGVPILTACFLCTLDPAVRRCSGFGIRCPFRAGVIHSCGQQEVGHCQVVTCNCLGTGAFLGPCANVQDKC